MDLGETYCIFPPRFRYKGVVRCFDTPDPFFLCIGPQNESGPCFKGPRIIHFIFGGRSEQIRFLEGGNTYAVASKSPTHLRHKLLYGYPGFDHLFCLFHIHIGISSQFSSAPPWVSICRIYSFWSDLSSIRSIYGIDKKLLSGRVKYIEKGNGVLTERSWYGGAWTTD